MLRKPVSSSDLKSVGYENGTLEIEFRNGGVYQYYNVPENTYLALITASSVGKYFHAYIKDRYRWQKISR